MIYTIKIKYMINVMFGQANDKTQEKEYPKLMSTSDGYLAFFFKERCGTCLKKPSNASDQIGGYTEYWTMNGFTDYNEPITIQNL